MRGIFNNLGRRNILRDVRTLILDGLAVPADLVTEIITSDSFNVRILSIRDVKHLNERKLQQALLYAIRPSRAENTPRIQAIYLFGHKDTTTSPRTNRKIQNEIASTPTPRTHSHAGVTSSQGAQIGAERNTKPEDFARNSENWFGHSGKLFSKDQWNKMVSAEWAPVIQACKGIISFDAVVCSGPRHSASTQTAVEGSKPAWYNHPELYIPPRIATYSIDGCNGCGKAPEGLSKLGCDMDRLPLLAPPTIHSSTTKAAKTPFDGISIEKRLLVRCVTCLHNRYCEGCHKWWCEDCYEINPGYNLHQSWNLRTELADSEKNVKVHMGLCVESCLVGEMMSGAGSNGMWG